MLAFFFDRWSRDGSIVDFQYRTNSREGNQLQNSSDLTKARNSTLHQGGSLDHVLLVSRVGL